MAKPLSFKDYLKQYAHFTDEDYALGEVYFINGTVKKGEVLPLLNSFTQQMGYINKGLFRSYYIDPKSGKEINTYFYQENQLMVSFMIFKEDNSCNYYIEALEDAEVTYIDQKDLQKLYRTSHKWEHFGRILAEAYYRGTYKRFESFTFYTPEERYMELLKDFPKIFQRTSLINISSYLGVESQSLSRIRKRIFKEKK